MKSYIIQILLTTLSYITPKKKNLIVLGSGDSKQFQGNPKYLYLYLFNNKNHDIKYYWSAKAKKQQEQLLKLNIPFIDPYTLKGFIIILRAQYHLIEKSSFDTSYTKSIFGRFRYIQTCHGSPQKKFGVDAIGQNSSLPLTSNQNTLIYKFLKKIKFFSRHKYYKILAPSEEIRRIYQRAFENNNVIITGYPRNDVMFSKKLLICNYFEVLNLSKYKKVILYAPTFRDNQDCIKPLSENLETQNLELNKLNYLLLVKKHPWQKSFKIPEGLSNILDVSQTVDDIQELLPFTDILITDYSGTFFDFMLSKKPVIFYPYDLEDYLKNCRGMYLDYYKDLPGPFAQNETELFSLLFSVDEWQKDPAYQAKYEQLLNRYNFYQDGHSSERVLQLLFPDFEAPDNRNF